MKLNGWILAAGLLFTQATAQAASCYSYDKKGIDIKWTAFKTPKKVGVTGKLPNYELSGKTKGTSVADLLQGQKIDIRVNKVDSGNPGRDMKIVKFFFSDLVGGDTMTAKVTNVTKNVITMDLVINGKKKEVPLTYTMEGMKLTAIGHMDILDFGLSKQLSAINKACYALHEGKTWSDVTLTLETTLSSCKS
jgi:polyisoprenoid-binding protein YceI